MRKQGQVSIATHYRRLRDARKRNCSVGELPDGRGRHGNAISSKGTKLLQSQARKKLWADPEWRAKVIRAMKKANNRPEVRASRSKALMGRKLSQSHIDAVRKAMNRPEIKAKKNTPEARAKISKSLKGRKKSELHQQRINEGIRRAVCRKEVIENHRLAARRSQQRPEVRARQRVAAIRRIKRGHSNCRGRQGGFFSNKMNRRLHYRSNLELAWYQLVEQMRHVKKYYVERYAIPYVVDGIEHLYLPDLFIEYVDGSHELIEIKPEGDWARGRIFQIKCHYAKLWCNAQPKPTTFRVVGYKEINKDVA